VESKHQIIKKNIMGKSNQHQLKWHQIGIQNKQWSTAPRCAYPCWLAWKVGLYSGRPRVRHLGHGVQKCDKFNPGASQQGAGALIDKRRGIFKLW